MKTHQTITGLIATFAITIAAATFGKGIPNNAAADLVLGQSNFTPLGFPSPLPNAASLRDPRGITTDANTGRVFIADSANNRVLRYASATALNNGAAADLVLGDPSFQGSEPGTSQKIFRFPTGVFVDRLGRLWVADSGNNRVLSFSNASFLTSNYAPADKVLGKAIFTTSTPGGTLSEMNAPNGVWVDSADRLWVADTANKRVLKFDAVSTKTNGSAADGSLGITFGGSDISLNEPFSLTVSPSGALFVADTSKHRVLRYDSAATLPILSSPSAVLGQPSFAGSSPATTNTGMQFPRGVFVTPDDTLWVTDVQNNRITRFNNASTKASGAAADGCVGQPNFLTELSGTTGRKLNFPGYQSVIDSSGNLWVPDAANHRVLRFPVDATPPTLTLKGKTPTAVKKFVTLKGTATDANGIARVQFRIGTGPRKTATGTAKWSFKATLKKGKNTITVFATDTAGNVSVGKVIKIKRK